MSRSRTRSAGGGFSYRGLLIALAVLAVVPGLAYSVWPSLSSSSAGGDPLMHTVERGEFIHEVIDRGTVESSSNVEVRCEVRSKGSGGTTILEIIPEGTYVQPGDVIARLDSSALEEQRVQQLIVCNSSEAAEIQARNAYETALIAKQEYEQGTYIEQLQALEAARVVAEENLRRARDYYEFSKRLAEKGYITRIQLETDEFSVRKAELDLQTAETKLHVLKEFTRRKELIRLESEIKTAEAKLRSAEATHRLDMEELARLESQIEKCTIRAPEAGQVVYANEEGYRGSREVIIEEGTQVYERQVIVRLPDPKRMQVKATISEGSISLIAAGMPVRIRLDAFPDVELTGVVEKVNDYPEPSPWYVSSVKEYQTIVRIHDPPPAMRAGLTAEVRILVAHLASVIRVPVQAVFEHGGKHYCVGGRPGDWQLLPVRLGPSNDKFVVIEAGLEAGQQIALNAAALREELDLPPLPARGPDRGQPAGGTPQPAAPRGGSRGPGADGPRSPSPSNGQAAAGSPSQNQPPRPSEIVKQLFSQFDKNQDQYLDNSELPSQFEPMFSEADSNGDGRLSRAELTTIVARFRQFSPPGQPRSEKRP